MLSTLIAKIDAELNTRANGYVLRIDDTLGEIVLLNDSSCIPQLLRFFDDDAEYVEMMYSIIHTIERFDATTFVQAIAENLGSFFESAPSWAITIHMRILNSPPTLAAYAGYIKSLSEEKRDVVRKVLEAVRKEDARFISRCDALIATI